MASIAIYMPDFASGGVQRQHLRLAPHLIAAGHDLTFIVHRAEGALAEQVPAEAKVVSLGVKRTVSAIRPLARYIKAARPDVLVANMGHPNLVALAANKVAGKASRIIASHHNHLTNQAKAEGGWQHKILPFLIRRFLRHADAIVAVSEGVAADLARVADLPRDQIRVIYNPAVPDEVAMLAAQPVKHRWLGESQPLVVAIGRLVPMKDFAMLIAAIADLPDARLLILGEGPLLDPLRAEAERLGIANRVDFAGFQANPYAFLSRAQLFVLSSKYEGFGNVIAEALACGTPVVSTDCESGPSEILDGGRFGTLVPVGDTAAMTAAMNVALAGPHDRAALIARGMEFSVSRAAAAYLALFDRVLGR